MNFKNISSKLFLLLFAVSSPLGFAAHGHPFYLQDAPEPNRAKTNAQHLAETGHPGLSTRWIAAGDLTTGDQIKKADGSGGTIAATQAQQITRTMYNLDVASPVPGATDSFYVGDGGWLVHNEEACNIGYLAFGKSGDVVQKIWNDPKLFENWLKGNFSKGSIDSPMTHDQAEAVISAARSMGMKIELNPAGLAGLEKNATWGPIPHFKIGKVHIPIVAGFKP